MFDLIENYIYIHQLDKYIILPVYPDNVRDSLGSQFNMTNILARTAPIFSYSNSGPRTVTFQLPLHRDLMSEVNKSNSKFLDAEELTDDYVDTLIRYLQAMALPTYGANAKNSKMVNPPQVSVRLGNSVFIKGVITSQVDVARSGPISRDKKYQEVTISFTVAEVEPQDAETLAKWGSFRGLEAVLTRNMYRS